MQLGKSNKCKILVSALSFATASFILEAHHKLMNDVIVGKFSELVRMCNITPIDSEIISRSIASSFSDFEDAMQYYSAIQEGADVIITRNPKDFASSQIPVYEPQTFLSLLLEA